MADSNLYGLTTVQATLDSTSQFYAVTGSAGSYTDTRLPVSVFLNNTVLTGTPTVPGYLTSALAASTYLTSANAASTYLTQANATSTYLTITTAASTYATITNLALKAPLASPTFTGTVTAAAITATGLITPGTVVGIKGTAAADSAQAGSIGEFAIANGGGAVTTATAANATTFLLTAGDWDVWGVAQFLPAGTTTMSLLAAGISLTSATRSTYDTETLQQIPFTTGQAQQLVTPIVRVNVSTSTNVYLVVFQSFGVSTMTANGTIKARRRR